MTESQRQLLAHGSTNNGSWKLEMNGEVVLKDWPVSGTLRAEQKETE